MNTGNNTVLHCLQSTTDAVTSLFFHTTPQHSCLKNYLLVGTADGTLVIYEDSVLKCADGAPVKLVQVGNVNTPLMCLAPSSHYQGRTTLWAGCGTRVLSLTVDYDISKSIDTRPAFDQKVKAVSAVSSKQMESLSSRVKALLVQHTGTLWIGTASGHILLVDLSTRQLLQVIDSGCHSVRIMASVLIETQGHKSVILVLGRRVHVSQDKIKSQSDLDAVLMIWSNALSQEVKDLNRHCKLREQIACKMQERAND